MEQNEKNPTEYGYVGNEIVEMKASEFMKLKSLVDYSLEEETKEYYPEKYKYVNRETGAVIKTVNEKNKHLAVKVMDFEATIASAPVIFRTKIGLEMLKVRLIAEGVHVNMVDKGIAKHRSFFESAAKDFAVEESERGVAIINDAEEALDNIGEVVQTRDEEPFEKFDEVAEDSAQG